MHTNLPMIKKKGIFDIIKKWFRKLLKKEDIIEEPIIEREPIIKEIPKSVFIDSIKVEGKDIVLVLQKKIENKEIEVSSLTDKELDELIELYKIQIEERSNILKKYKEKIIITKKEN